MGIAGCNIQFALLWNILKSVMFLWSVFGPRAEVQYGTFEKLSIENLGGPCLIMQLGLVTTDKDGWRPTGKPEICLSSDILNFLPLFQYGF